MLLSRVTLMTKKCLSIIKMYKFWAFHGGNVSSRFLGCDAV